MSTRHAGIMKRSSLVVLALAIAGLLAQVAFGQGTAAPVISGPDPGGPEDRYTTNDPNAIWTLCDGGPPTVRDLDGDPEGPCRFATADRGPGPDVTLGPLPVKRAGFESSRTAPQTLQLYATVLTPPRPDGSRDAISSRPVPITWPVFAPRYRALPPRFGGGRRRAAAGLAVTCPQACLAFANVYAMRGSQVTKRLKALRPSAARTSWRLTAKVPRSAVRRGRRVLVEFGTYLPGRSTGTPRTPNDRFDFPGHELVQCHFPARAPVDLPHVRSFAGGACTAYNGLD